ncbi:MAG TPA: MBL fold metallo-hydrolase, partial [Thermoanaerobaculia bacterium]|nr:MBL fold metallo-hydrolase [Thermoanaerobaculia bacterium]
VLTHGHQDHFGLARRIADRGKAKLFGGRRDGRAFRMERRGRRILDEMARAGFGVATRLAVTASVAWVDRFAEPLREWDALEGGEVLPGDGYTLRVGAAPGHTPGSLVFELPEVNVLFTGDTILHRITPNAVVMEDPERKGEIFRSLSRYRETLDAVERSNGSSRLLTGHGEAIDDFPTHRREVERRYVERRRAIEQALSEGPLTVRDIGEKLFPKGNALGAFLVFSELTGFLMAMEDEGRVEKLEGRVTTRYALRKPSTSPPPDAREVRSPRPAPAPARSRA